MLQVLQDSVTNPDLAQAFTICRSTGSYVAGGWSETSVQIPAYGVVTVATDRQIESLAEADRLHGARMFLTTQPIYTTSRSRAGEGGTPGTSDVLLFNNQSWRVASVGNYADRGHYYAIALKMEGA